MSFSYDVKKELSNIKIEAKINILTELCGAFYFGGYIDGEKLAISSENKYSTDRIWNLIDNLHCKKKLSPIYLSDKSCNLRCIHTIKINFKYNIFENKIGFCTSPYLMNEKLYNCFLRGVFISCGNILDPNSKYHLEINVSNEKLCDTLIEMFESCKSLNISPGVIKRKNKFVIYIKDSQKIIDFLVFIGATKSAMKFMQIKMVKEMRNNINRSTNFETANLSKITSSSAKQVSAIKKLKENNKFNFLPEHLKETAYLRINNPYASLEELSKISKKPVTKSGINHRLKKLVDISEEI